MRPHQANQSRPIGRWGTKSASIVRNRTLCVSEVLLCSEFYVSKAAWSRLCSALPVGVNHEKLDIFNKYRDLNLTMHVFYASGETELKRNDEQSVLLSQYVRWESPAWWIRGLSLCLTFGSACPLTKPIMLTHIFISENQQDTWQLQSGGELLGDNSCAHSQPHSLAVEVKSQALLHHEFEVWTFQSTKSIQLFCLGVSHVSTLFDLKFLSIHVRSIS
jgi:hypothetical protein